MRIPERLTGPAATREINAMIVAAMGVFLVGCGVTEICQLLNDNGGWDWHCIVPVLDAVVGIVLLLFPHSKPRYVVPLAAGLYAVGNIVGETEHLLEGMSTLFMLVLITSIAVLIGSIHRAAGDRHSTTRILAVLLVHFAVLMPAMFLMFVVMPRFLEITISSYELMFEVLFLTTLIFYLLRPGVRDDGFDRRINMGMRAVASILSTSSGAFVYADEVDGLVGKDRSGWIPSEEGRILSRTSTVYDENREFAFASEIWEGEDSVRISVRQRGANQYMATSFVLLGYSVEESGDGKYLRLYGEGGRYMRILIADRPEEKRKARDSVSDDSIEEAEIGEENELDPV